MKKALIVASVASMIEQFNRENINILDGLGYQVFVSTNFTEPGNISLERARQLKEELENRGIVCIDTPFHRNPLHHQNLKAFRILNRLVREQNIDLIHSHSPTGGILARLVGRINKVSQNIYTAHGFHFFKGGPLLNWIAYFPVEWLLSNWTNVLITINEEDYQLAKKIFKVKSVYKIPGVGIDYNAFQGQIGSGKELRASLGLKPSDFVLLSVGELNSNKNHLTVIKALETLKDDRLKYVIVGEGRNRELLESYITGSELAQQVHLIGYRKDVAQLCDMADVFCFPSRREGFGLAAVEGMAMGLPLLTSNIRGVTEYSKAGLTGFLYNPMDVKGFSEGIRLLMDDSCRERMSCYNREAAKQYDVSIVNQIMTEIYASFINHIIE